MIKGSETRDDGSYEGKFLPGIVAIGEFPYFGI